MREGELEEENSAKESRKQRDNWAVQHKVMVAKGPVSMCVSAYSGWCTNLVNFYQLWRLTQSLSKPLRPIVVYNVLKLKFTYSSEQPGDLARALLKAKETNQHVEDANPYFKVKASRNSFANLKLLLEVDTHMSSPVLAQPQIANCSIEGNYGSGHVYIFGWLVVNYLLTKEGGKNLSKYEEAAGC
ncbi:hypothetical protein PO909_032048 [Leuciscus waleckii]